MLVRALPMIAGHAGAWLLAAALTARLRTGSRGTDAVALLVLHLLIVSLLVLAAGTMGALNVWGLTAAGVVAGALGAGLGGMTAVRRGWTACREVCAAARSESPVLFWLTIGVLALVGIRHGFNIWFFVPATLDGNEYHLPRLATWIQNGNLQRPFMLEQRSYFPAGMQLLQAWWVGFLHHDVVIEAASTEGAVLGAFAVAALGRKLGLSCAGSLLGGALWVTAPVVLLQGALELNDVATSSCVLAAFATAWRPGRTFPSIAIACTALALGTGIKPTVAFAAPGVIVLAALSLRKREGVLEAGHVGAVLLGLFVGSYWFLVNAVQFGSPLYPVVASHEASARVGLGASTVATRPTVGRLVRNATNVFGHRLIGNRGEALGPDVGPAVHEATGWGWPVTLLGLPAIIAAAVVRRRDLVRTALAPCMMLSLITTLALVEDDAWNARFVIWAAAGPSLALAWCLPQAGRWQPVAGGLLLAGAVVNVAQSFVPPLPFAGTRWAALRVTASQPVDQRGAGSLVFLLLPEEERRWAADDRPVLCMTMSYPTYALAGPGMRRRVEFGAFAEGRDLVEEMARRGCPLLLVINVPRPVLAAVEEAVARGWLEIVGPGWFRLTDNSRH